MPGTGWTRTAGNDTASRGAGHSDLGDRLGCWTAAGAFPLFKMQRHDMQIRQIHAGTMQPGGSHIRKDVVCSASAGTPVGPRNENSFAGPWNLEAWRRPVVRTAVTARLGLASCPIQHVRDRVESAQKCCAAPYHPSCCVRTLASPIIARERQRKWASSMTRKGSGIYVSAAPVNQQSTLPGPRRDRKWNMRSAEATSCMTGWSQRRAFRCAMGLAGENETPGQAHVRADIKPCLCFGCRDCMRVSTLWTV